MAALLHSVLNCSKFGPVQADEDVHEAVATAVRTPISNIALPHVK